MFRIIRPTIKKVTAMGMDKLANQSAPGSTTDTKIIGWTARAGSNVVNDELVVDGTGVINITGQVTLTSSLISNSFRLEIVHNTTEIGTVTVSSGSVITTTVNGINVVPGSRIWLRFDRPSISAYTIAASGTYLSWTVV